MSADHHRLDAEVVAIPRHRAPVTPEPADLLAQRVDLNALLSQPLPEIEWLPTVTLGERIIYREALTIVSGHKKSGKSWAMLATALDCARAGQPALYIDMENGARTFHHRLALLGVDAESLPSDFHYIQFPAGLSLDGFGDQLRQIAEMLPGAFVVVDSLRGLLGRLTPSGRPPLNPNDHQDMEAAFGPLMEAVKTSGLTICVIDHAKKGAKDSDEFATAGAAAKEAAVDAVYFWTKVEPYSEAQAGVVKLSASSDRMGLLDFERLWSVGGQGQDAPIAFEPLAANRTGAAGRILNDVRQLLADNAGREWTKTAVRREVKGDNGAIDEALSELALDLDVPIHAVAVARGREVYVWDEDRVTAEMPPF